MMSFVFPILVPLFICGLIYYLTKRITKSFGLRKFWITFSTIVLLTFLSLFGSQNLALSETALGRIVSNSSAFWIMAVLYGLLSFAIIHIVGTFSKIKPKAQGIGGIVMAAGIIGYGIFNSYSIRVTEVTVPIKGLEKPMKVVHLTDIHLGNFRGKNFLSNVAEKINELQPDLILHTGDLFDSGAHFYPGSDVLSPFKNLQAPHYFVEGNHDQAVGIEKVIPLVEEQGIHFLRNQITSAGPFQLIGFNNMAKDSISFDLHTIPGEETIFSVVQDLEIDPIKPTIALHHRPDGGEYLEPKGVDLLLAGHTHGGQMFPFTLIAKQMYTYLDGLYQFQNLSIYVSEGVGTIFFPIRIGTQSEITLIHLIPN